MIQSRTSRVLTALCAAGALALTSCSQVSNQSSSTAGTSGAITIGPGVTKEPCPKAVDKSHGCIYLGVLSDLSEGPFAALATVITEAQRNYWKKVNESGGISGYEVDLETNTKDTKYQAAEHAAAYQQIKGNILALAQTLGTVNTAAILPDMDANDIVGVPASWWSGYNFKENDKGLILEVGYSYCTEAMVGLDWYTEKNAKPTSVVAVGYPGDYGGDSAAGVKQWGEINGVSNITVVPTGPNQVRGNQDAVVAAVKSANPSLRRAGRGTGRERRDHRQARGQRVPGPVHGVAADVEPGPAQERRGRRHRRQVQPHVARPSSGTARAPASRR